MKTKHLLRGTAAALLLFAFYLLVLLLVNGAAYTLNHLRSYGFLILPLVAGFGLQAALFSHIQSSVREMRRGAAAGVAASGGISAGSMVACCAHHLADLLPVLGISGALLFLSEYQALFLVAGLLSNLIGITMMLGIIQEQKLYRKGELLARLMRLNMKQARNILIWLSVAVLLSSAAFIALTPGQSSPAPGRTIQLEGITSEGNGVSVTAKPFPVASGTPVQFEIAVDTHSGALDFEMSAIALLQDSNGNTYTPTDWEGSPPGGHHRSGTLAFPALSGNPESIKLVLREVGGVPERTFQWKLTQ